MTTDHTQIASRDCARLRPLLPLLAHDVLQPRDAQRLRDHVDTCPRCQAELAAYDRLDAALRRSVTSAPAPSITGQDIIQRLERPTISASPRPDALDTQRRGSRPLATALSAVAALIVVGLFAHLLLSGTGGSTPPTGSLLGLPEPTATIQYDPSQFFLGGPVGQLVLSPAPASLRDPRVVFARDLRINMCATYPVGAVGVTWLTTSPTFGLALVEAHCDGGARSVALVSLTSRLNGLACKQWSAAATIDNRPSDAAPLPPDAAGSIPAWLPLPRQSYIGQQAVAPDGSVAEQVYMDWLYADQTYAAARYVGKAYQPQNARSITLDGHAGWVTTDSAYTTVTVPLPGGQVFFFDGTVDTATVEPLAQTTLAHLDDLLPRVGTPSPDPSFSC